MKLLTSMLFSLLCISMLAEEIKEVTVSSEVNEVTVFIEGAQVTRIKSVKVPAGKSVLKFEGLSPFVDAKSVQAKVDGDVTVLSVNHQKNFVKKAAKSDEIFEFQKQIKAIEEKLEMEYAYLSILKEELVFLNENRNLGGKNEQVSVVALQQASEYYGRRLKELKMASIARNRTVKDLKEEQNQLTKQIKMISSEEEFPTGEVLVKVDSKSATQVKVNLSYLVSNAGWLPSYDIRAESVVDPIELIYKANVRQDTKVDWNNVLLSFSSTNPNVSGVAPELQPYFLNYYSKPPVYGALQSNSIEGKVYDDAGYSLPGVTIMVEGSTIGTMTDSDGAFSITIPNANSSLSFSFIGMKKKIVRPSGAFMTVYLESNEVSLDEVVVMGYGSQSRIGDALQGQMAGISVKNKPFKIRGASSKVMAVDKVENQTSVEFKIEKPYTVKSNNKSLAVDMVSYDLPVEYQYYCVPKINNDAFLLAYIKDWEKYDLLEGEANIFFENTYVGKTLLDVRYSQDTLELSLGRDKGVSVQREKVKDYKSKRFVGNKREDLRAWTINVKNNKSETINMLILDQVPVSTLDEIEVRVLDKSGARFDQETGEIRWSFEMEPATKEELELKYSIKYPRSQSLNIE